MAELIISIDRAGPVSILRVQGEGDAENVAPLDAAVDSILQSKPQRVVVDCTSLSYISSVGMGALARLSHAMRPAATAIVVGEGHVFDVLTRSRVIELFKHFATTDAALKQ